MTRDNMKLLYYLADYMSLTLSLTMRNLILFSLIVGFSGVLAQAPLINGVQILKTPTSQYDRLEIRAEISSLINQRYDYDSIVFGGLFVSPERDTAFVDGFYYQHFIVKNNQLIPFGEPHFRLRFTPDKAGTWQYRLFVSDIYGSYQTDIQSFTVNASNKGGFLKFVPPSNYLHNSKGEPVFLAGENIAWANLPDGGDAMTYYLSKVHQHEMNFAKLMMTPWAYQIEWIESGWRNYSGRQRQAFMMDSIFRMADSLNIYLQLAFSIHDELNFGYPAEDWTSNPYNVANGGCCVNAWEFFSHPQAMSAFRNRLRYLAARWGYSTKLFGWELLSEADNFPWYRTYQQSIANWSHQMAGYLRAKDPAKRAVSVGFALSSSNPAVWQSENIQFTQLHHYKKTPDIEGEVAALQGTYLQAFNKPVLTGEFGLGHVGDSLVLWDPQGLALHNSLWTAAMTGSFAGVVPWFWENYIDIQNLYPLFTPLSIFMNQSDLNLSQLIPRHLTTQSSSYLPLAVSPRFDLLQKSPSRQFTLQPTGVMLPTQDSLPVFLYGPQSVLAGLRNPPEFNGQWQQSGIMRIQTGVQALNAVIQVKLNGQTLLEQTAQSNSEYVVMIPQGLQTVTIDNRGQGFFSILEISKIVFENYAPDIRAFGLMGQHSALAWVHNRHSHWQNLQSGGVWPEVSGAVYFPELQGNFLVNFFNTRSGQNDSAIVISAAANGLWVNINSLQNDLALRIDPAPSSINETRDYHAKAFPNPFHHLVKIVPPDSSPDERFRLEIADLSGRIIYESHCAPILNDGIAWNGNTREGTLAKTGLYVFKLISSKGRVYTGKLLKY